MQRLLLLLALFAAAPVVVPAVVPVAHASPEAERNRLEEELQKLAQRNAWSGVERTYADLLELGLALPPNDHFLGAQAAQSRGDTLAAMERLEKAVAAGAPTEGADGAEPSEAAPDPAWVEAKQSLEALQARYGKVDITVVPPRLPALVRYDMPFSAQEREAIVKARDAIRNGLAYKGLLPVGKYMIDGLVFEVESGADLMEVRVTPPQ